MYLLFNFFFPPQETYLIYTLQDCVNFSSTILGENYYKPLFIAYQLLGVMKDMHDKGLAVGDITLSDILISNNLWIQVISLQCSYSSASIRFIVELGLTIPFCR